jgi:ADP-ribose pyrophosphatase YjhB (NUDIX family)
MYVGEERVREAERAWGVPGEVSFRVPTSDEELAFIRETQRHGRAHDITLVIRRGDRYAVIAKPDYPDGAYRLPSGGIAPGETVEEGAKREGLEETGLEIEIRRYLLRSRVVFEAAPESEEDSIHWISHVLEAVAVGGELRPIDRTEIRDARWIDRDSLLGPIRERLLTKRAAGILYRVGLHDAIFARVDRSDVRDGNAPERGDDP